MNWFRTHRSTRKSVTATARLCIAVVLLLLAASVAHAGGNVEVYVWGGKLHVEGDFAANAFTVHDFGGQLNIAVIPGPGTTVNFGDETVYADFRRFVDIVIRTGNGDDDVRIVSSTSERLRDITVNLGRGGRGSFTLEPEGAGRITVGSLSVSCSKFNTQPQVVRIERAQILGKLRVVSASGADRVEIVDSTVRGPVKIVMGAGNDRLNVRGSTFGRNAQIDAGRDDDTVDLAEGTDFEGRLTIATDTGSDRIVSRESFYRQAVSVASRGDLTFASESDEWARGLRLKARRGRGIYRLLRSNVAKTLGIGAGSGDDDVEVEACTFTGKVNVATGAGDDVIRIAGNRCERGLRVNGGKGDDVLRNDVAADNEILRGGARITNVEQSPE